MRVLEIIMEASGGMFDRGLEQQSGAKIQFTNGEQTYELLDVAIFPQDDRRSYNEPAPEEPATQQQTQPQAQQPAPQWTGRQKPQQATQTQVQQPTEVEPELEPEEEPIMEDQIALDAMKVDVENYMESIGSYPAQYIGTSKSSGAAMVVTLGTVNEGGESTKMSFVKFYKQKSTSHPPLYWQTSAFSRDTGFKQVGSGKSATAKASELKISPYDFVKPETPYRIDNLPDLIRNQLATRDDKFPPSLISGIPMLLENLGVGNNEPVPDIAQYHSVLGVVLGETAAPVALYTGNNVSGAYQEAEQQMLANLIDGQPLTWADFNTVTFGKHGAAIGDSTMQTADGSASVIVSSKNDAGGAPASLTGAMETINNPKYQQDFGKGSRFYKSYKDIVDILQILDKGTAITGLVAVAEHLGWINKYEMTQFISTIYGKGKIKDSEIKQYPGLWELYTQPRKVDKTNKKYQPGFHILSTMAVNLKKHLNQDLPRITAFFKAVLNKSSMVQVYTKVGQNKDGLWFDNFDVVWPPTFKGSIVVESDFFTAQAKPSKKLSFYFK
jgi:hypothetical protein